MSKDEDEIIFHDRYSALGMERPDPSTVCKGQCEGIGRVPVKLGGGFPRVRECSEILRRRWHEAEAKKPSKDGWHFVTCPDCKGTGKTPVQEGPPATPVVT